MAAKRKAAVKLQCAECKRVNYHAHKSRMLKQQENERKLELKKFCISCRKHVQHAESKK